MINTRARATQLIDAVFTQHKHLNTIDLFADVSNVSNTNSQDYAPSDKAFIQALIFGTIRWFPRLKFILDQLLEKPLKKQDQDLVCLMACGLFQLIFLNTPAYACVTESVEATRQLNKPWAAKLVNAVLRNYQRRAKHLEALVEHDEIAYFAHPQWLIDRLKKHWPLHWHAILCDNNQEAPLCLRINLRQTTRENYIMLLSKAGIIATPLAHTQAGVLLNNSHPIPTLPGFEAGLFSVQDGASQMIATLLNLKPGLRVLDACAAPGGKSGLILETEPGLSELVALDRSKMRLKTLLDNLQRLQLKATIIQTDTCDTATWWDGRLFDRILLDAPCSATGIIRRHPDIKYHLKPDHLIDLNHRQLTLLESLWPLLKPEGLLLYTTCSILPEENVELTQKFISQHSDAIAMPIALPIGIPQTIGHQLLPGQDQTDGFYYACIRKF